MPVFALLLVVLAQSPAGSTTLAGPPHPRTVAGRAAVQPEADGIGIGTKSISVRAKASFGLNHAVTSPPITFTVLPAFQARRSLKPALLAKR